MKKNPRHGVLAKITPKILTPLFLIGNSSAVIISGTGSVDPSGFGPGFFSVATSDVSLALGDEFIFQPLDIDTFQIESYLVANPFSYFELPFGTPLHTNNPPTGTPLVTNLFALPTPLTTFDIPDGGSIFLGVEFGSGNPAEFIDYGWIELQNDGGIVSAAGSAIALDLPGLIVGTTTQIPEPSSAILLLAAPLLSFKRRR